MGSNQGAKKSANWLDPTFVCSQRFGPLADPCTRVPFLAVETASRGAVFNLIRRPNVADHLKLAGVRKRSDGDVIVWGWVGVLFYQCEWQANLSLSLGRGLGTWVIATFVVGLFFPISVTSGRRHGMVEELSQIMKLHRTPCRWLISPIEQFFILFLDLAVLDHLFSAFQFIFECVCVCTTVYNVYIYMLLYAAWYLTFFMVKCILKVLFIEMYVIDVFDMSYLHRAVSLTRVRKWRFIGMIYYRYYLCRGCNLSGRWEHRWLRWKEGASVAPFFPAQPWLNPCATEVVSYCLHVSARRMTSGVSLCLLTGRRCCVSAHQRGHRCTP